jgi:hypothetical protein
MNIGAKWAITPDKARPLLGGADESAFAEWQADPEHAVMDKATLTRISLVIGIFKGLNISFGQPLADRWITAPNERPLFGGQAPIDFMVDYGENAPGAAVGGCVERRQLMIYRMGTFEECRNLPSTALTELRPGGQTYV